MASSASAVGLSRRLSGQGCEPIGILGLQRQQIDDRVTPTLGAAASRGLDRRVSWPRRSGRGRRRRRQLAGAIASLALSVAQRVLAIGFAASRHGPDLRYVTHYNGSGSQRGLPFSPSGEFSAATCAGLHPAARCLRRLSPLSSMRCALWTMRSRMASASVGSPTISYQRSRGTWLVMINEAAL